MKPPKEYLENFLLLHGSEKTIKTLEDVKKYCDMQIEAIKELPPPMQGLGDWLKGVED
jgi:hypothetical protein